MYIVITILHVLLKVKTCWKESMERYVLVCSITEALWAGGIWLQGKITEDRELCEPGRENEKV